MLKRNDLRIKTSSMNFFEEEKCFFEGEEKMTGREEKKNRFCLFLLVEEVFLSYRICFRRSGNGKEKILHFLW